MLLGDKLRDSAMLLVIALTAGPAAYGQYTSPSSGAVFNNPVSAIADTIVTDSIMAKNAIGYRKKDSRRNVRPADRPPNPTRPPSSGTTTFTPGRRAILDNFPGTQRQQAAQLLSKCEKLYATTMSGLGAIDSPAQLNDVATATAFYMFLAHHIYWDGQPGAPPPAQKVHVRNLRQTLHSHYLSAGTMLRKSDLEKQNTQDGLLLSVCLPMMQYAQAKKSDDQTARQAARDLAADLLRKVRLSPTAISFRSDGSVHLGD